MTRLFLTRTSAGKQYRTNIEMQIPVRRVMAWLKDTNWTVMVSNPCVSKIFFFQNLVQSSSCGICASYKCKLYPALIVLHANVENVPRIWTNTIWELTAWSIGVRLFPQLWDSRQCFQTSSWQLAQEVSVKVEYFPLIFDLVKIYSKGLKANKKNWLLECFIIIAN